MNSKKVIIVGNGSDVLSKEHGHKIDNFDYVVRMGDAPRIIGYEKYIGTKTNMYRIKWFNLFHTETGISNTRFGEPRTTFDFDISQCDILSICQDPDQYKETAHTTHRYYDVSLNRNFLLPIGNRFLHDACIEKFNLKQKWYFFNAHDNADLMQEMQLLRFTPKKTSISEKWLEPSGGLCTIWFFLKYMPYQIYITGFDSWKTSHYWKPGITQSFSSHSSFHERLYINYLIKKKYIYELQ